MLLPLFVNDTHKHDKCKDAGDTVMALPQLAVTLDESLVSGLGCSLWSLW